MLKRFASPLVVMAYETGEIERMEGLPMRSLRRSRQARAAGRAGTSGQSAVPGVRETEMARAPNKGMRALRILGPGFITGASDDDPSGIGTYLIAGASLGYTTLWTALMTFPMMACVQYTCSRIGLVTGMGLAGILRRHYSRSVVYPLVGASSSPIP